MRCEYKDQKDIQERVDILNARYRQKSYELARYCRIDCDQYRIAYRSLASRRSRSVDFSYDISFAKYKPSDNIRSIPGNREIYDRKQLITYQLGYSYKAVSEFF